MASASVPVPLSPVNEKEPPDRFWKKKVELFVPSSETIVFHPPSPFQFTQALTEKGCDVLTRLAELWAYWLVPLKERQVPTCPATYVGLLTSVSVLLLPEESLPLPSSFQ